jgi:peroxiredoxin
MKTTTIPAVSNVLKNMFKVTLIALFLVSLNACSNDDDKADTTTTPPVAVNTTAPDFSLTSLDSKTYKLSEQKNKVVVLFFFGNECPSCKAAAPKVCMELHAPYASRADFQIYGIDQWDGNSAKVQSFLDITKVGFPLLLTGSSVAASYKTTYDRIVIIDKSGKVAFSGTQGAASDIAAAKAKIDELLK